MADPWDNQLAVEEQPTSLDPWDQDSVAVDSPKPKRQDPYAREEEVQRLFLRRRYLEATSFGLDVPQSIIEPVFDKLTAKYKLGVVDPMDPASEGEIPGEKGKTSLVFGPLAAGWLKLEKALADLPRALQYNLTNSMTTFLPSVGDQPAVIDIPGGTRPRQEPMKSPVYRASKQFSQSVKDGVEDIIQRHPEMQVDGLENVAEAFKDPAKFVRILSEALPMMMAAGFATAAGAPTMGIAIIYASEKNSAMDDYMAKGATFEEAEDASHVYATGATALEFLQIKQGLKLFGGFRKAVVAQTARKLAATGAGKEISKRMAMTALVESIEEMGQGSWQEVTGVAVLLQPIEGGFAGFADRRAQDALFAIALTLATGSAGAVRVTAFQKAVESRRDEVVEALENGQYDVAEELMQDALDDVPEPVITQESQDLAEGKAVVVTPEQLEGPVGPDAQRAPETPVGPSEADGAQVPGQGEIGAEAAAAQTPVPIGEAKGNEPSSQQAINEETQFFQDRLTEPELADQGVLFDTRSGPALAVPLGEDRVSGSLQVSFKETEQADAQEVFDVLSEKEGFDNLRIDEDQGYYTVAWGEPVQTGPGTDVQQGKQYGYSQKAINQFIRDMPEAEPVAEGEETLPPPADEMDETLRLPDKDRPKAVQKVNAEIKENPAYQEALDELGNRGLLPTTPGGGQFAGKYFVGKQYKGDVANYPNLKRKITFNRKKANQNWDEAGFDGISEFLEAYSQYWSVRASQKGINPDALESARKSDPYLDLLADMKWMLENDRPVSEVNALIDEFGDRENIPESMRETLRVGKTQAEIFIERGKRFRRSMNKLRDQLAKARAVEPVIREEQSQERSARVARMAPMRERLLDKNIDPDKARDYPMKYQVGELTEYTQRYESIREELGDETYKELQYTILGDPSLRFWEQTDISLLLQWMIEGRALTRPQSNRLAEYFRTVGRRKLDALRQGVEWLEPDVEATVPDVIKNVGEKGWTEKVKMLADLRKNGSKVVGQLPLFKSEDFGTFQEKIDKLNAKQKRRLVGLGRLFGLYGSQFTFDEQVKKLFETRRQVVKGLGQLFGVKDAYNKNFDALVTKLEKNKKTPLSKADEQFLKGMEDIAIAASNRVPFTDKFLEALVESLNVPRTTLASTDQSGLLRQGRALLQAHPTLAPAFIENYHRAFLSEAYAKELEESLLMDSDYKDAVRAGLEMVKWGNVDAKLHELGEEFVGAQIRWVQKIPGIRASERSFVTVLNSLRLAVYKKLVHGTEQNRDKFMTLSEKTHLANVINNLSGRTHLPKALAALTPILNAFFFSSRFSISRFMPLYDVPAGGVRSLVGRDYSESGRGKLKLRAELQPELSLAIRSAVSLMATNLLINMLLQLSFPDDDDLEIENDPGASGWGKIRYKHIRIDLWAGYVQAARYLWRMGTGEIKTEIGRTREIDRLDETVRFIKTKRSPIVSFIWDAAVGEDMMGVPFGAAPKGELGEMLDEWGVPEGLQGGAREILSRTANLVAQDSFDALVEMGIPWAVTAGIIGFYGGGVQTYPPSGFALVQEEKNRVAQKGYNKLWDDLKPSQQLDLRDKHKTIENLELKAKRDSYPVSNLDISENAKVAKRIHDALSPAVQEALNESAIKTGISRKIASGFWLNKERYEEYERLAVKYIDEMVGEALEDEADLGRIVTFARKVAREDLLDKIEEGKL